MIFSVNPELEARIREQAERQGRDPNAILEGWLEEALDRAEAVDGIGRGFEESNAGRVTSLSQVIERARKRHNFPQDWPKSL